MPGIRLQHVNDRSVTYSIADESRPYRVPLACTGQIVINGELRPCGRTHVFKTYHLNLDETGAVIVSQTIWERMAAKFLAAGFRLANEVKEPPAQTLFVPTIAVRPRLRDLGELNQVPRMN